MRPRACLLLLAAANAQAATEPSVGAEWVFWLLAGVFGLLAFGFVFALVISQINDRTIALENMAQSLKNIEQLLEDERKTVTEMERLLECGSQPILRRRVDENGYWHPVAVLND